MSDLEIKLTDNARKKFVEFLEAEEEEGLGIRLAIAGRGPHGLNYQLDVVSEAEEAATHDRPSLVGLRP